MSNFEDLREAARRTNEAFLRFNKSYAAALKRERRLRFDSRFLWFWRFYYWAKTHRTQS